MSTEASESAAAFHAFEHRGWEAAADTYHAYWRDLTSQSIGPLLDPISVGRGTRLLDIASGPGYVAAMAAQRGAEVVGIDFSAAMVEKARALAPAVDFREGDAEALPFADEEFDAAAMSFGMLHLTRPEQAMREAWRVLRPGGRFAFTVWAPPEEAVAFGLVLGAIRAHGTLDVPLPPGPPFFRFSDPEESVRRLLDAGFIDTTVARVPQVWRLPSPDALFEAFLHGTARTGPTLQAQTPDALRAIRAAIIETSATYAIGSVLEIPMPAVLASAVKPG